MLRHLNPFYIKEKQVVPELVLAVRLLAVYLLFTREFPFNGNQGSGRFFPILDFLADIGTDAQFNAGVRCLYLGGVALLLFSRYVRAGAFCVGMSFAIGLLSCQTCISVAHLFTGCVFLCTALSNAVTGTDLIRFQLAVLYLGADLNKFADIDWWNGDSIETLLVTKHHIASYMRMAAVFPPKLLSQVTGISVIVLQMGIAILLLFRRTAHFAIFLALVLHLPMVVLMKITFGPFVFALATAYGSLLRWPARLVCNEHIHSHLLIGLLRKADFNEQLVPCTAPVRETPARWLRTCIDFISHPLMLFGATLLAVLLIRYGQFVLLTIVTVTAACLYAWPRRRCPQRPASVTG